jgi:hypothetical protein
MNDSLYLNQIIFEKIDIKESLLDKQKKTVKVKSNVLETNLKR